MTIHTTIQTSARGPRRTLSLHWRSTLRVGHVVSFRFPLDEKPEPLAKARPCLVVDRWHDGNTLKLALAYGTT